MVEWDGLENRCTGNGTVGSNPTLSAIWTDYQLIAIFIRDFKHGKCKTCFLYQSFRRHI